MKRPMTTKEFFNKIDSILKEKGKLPDILDYGLGAYEPVPLKTCEFDLKSNLGYGGSEGIYLDLRVEFFANGEKCMHALGTYKTLEDDNEAMHIMAGLLADFIIETSVYVGRNQDEFTWEGADVHVLDETGKRANWGYCCGCMEDALKKKDTLLEKYPEVIIRDNATREEKRFSRETEGENGQVK